MLKRLAVASLLAALLPLRAAALQTEDLLALVAMPLAVAAVSEMTDVPQEQLMDVVALLNNANVPPAQFIEVVRYVPVALVTPSDIAFADFVRAQEQQGVLGTQLVTVIEERYRTLGVPANLVVVAPRVVEIDRDEFIPEIVRTRVAEVKAHPHGGPPGQLKKAIGVQTGAEIVHGERPKEHAEHVERVIVAQPRTKFDKREIHEDRGHDRSFGQGQGQGHGQDHAKQSGGGEHGGGKGKGKGKG